MRSRAWSGCWEARGWRAPWAATRDRRLRRRESAAAGADCAAVKVPAEPDLVAWDASSRAQLDKLRRQGVVAVRYEMRDCELSLELLPQCVGPKNRYVYSPVSETDTKIARDQSELFAQLPLGAENVSGLISGRRAFRADAKVVGTVGLPAGSTITEYDLVGPECKRATHVIGAVYVGGFATAVADARDLDAKNLFASATPIEGMTREGQAQILRARGGRGDRARGLLGAPARRAHPSRRKGAAADVSGGLRLRRQALRARGRCDVRGRVVRGSRRGLYAGRARGREPRVFDQNAVERLVREKQGAVKRKCWETASESVRRVNIAVTTTIEPQGRVTRADAQLVDSDGSADVGLAVARCIAGEIQTWQFPEPERQQVLTLPFHFIRQ